MTVLKVQDPNVFWKCLDKTLLTSVYKNNLNGKTKEEEFGHKHKHTIMNIIYMRENIHINKNNKMTRH